VPQEIVGRGDEERDRRTNQVGPPFDVQDLEDNKIYYIAGCADNAELWQFRCDPAQRPESTGRTSGDPLRRRFCPRARDGRRYRQVAARPA
jgi:hypothetical protein